MDDIYKKNNYPSIKRFKELLKENNIKKTEKEIKFFLDNQRVHQLHQPVAKIKQQFKSFTASAPNEIWQIDLLDYHQYSKVNKGHNWFFIRYVSSLFCISEWR
jgi:hypothetical protein